MSGNRATSVTGLGNGCPGKAQLVQPFQKHGALLERKRLTGRARGTTVDAQPFAEDRFGGGVQPEPPDEIGNFAGFVLGGLRSGEISGIVGVPDLDPELWRHVGRTVDTSRRTDG